jgi:hypothetical protein
MSKPRLFSSLMLLVISLAACAPGSGTVPSSQTTAMPSPTLLPILNSATPAKLSPMDALTSTPLPIATSRGPELHATDPTTVSLASGGLQLVEFFRFT